jgi:hypothetical protein
MQSKPQGQVQLTIQHYFEREIGKSEENQEYNVSTANVNIAQLNGKVLKSIPSAHGDNVTVYDKHGATEIKTDKLPRSQEAWAKSFHMKIVTNTRNLKAIIMVGHQLAMNILLSEMKQGIQMILRLVDGFVKYNAWNEHLDSCVAGYMANLHPVHHNREKVQTDIEHFLGNMMEIDGDDPIYPEFKVVPSHASDNKSNK